jgi:hypothetical protein
MQHFLHQTRPTVLLKHPSVRRPVPSNEEQPSKATCELTILADTGESAAEAVENWAHELEWIERLFSKTWRRCKALHFLPEEQRSVSTSTWNQFVQQVLPQTLIPYLLKLREALSLSRSLQEIIEIESSYSRILSRCQEQRSKRAGTQLLDSTEAALYQGMLGHYRRAWLLGDADGHFLTVWALVAHLFQLNETVMLSEFLRLECRYAVKLAQIPEPSAAELTLMTRHLLQQARATQMNGSSARLDA